MYLVRAYSLIVFEFARYSTPSVDVSIILTALESQFEEKFKDIFEKNSSSTSIVNGTSYGELARRSLSNLLGGMGYFHGTPAVAGFHSSEIEPISLFSGTPSRTNFPRGFLWDEGFHQLLILEWDIGLTVQVLTHWLNALYFTEVGDPLAFKGAWMPREMILGRESNRRVPEEFVTQSTSIGNPPTMLLVVDALLDKYDLIDHCAAENVCDSSEREAVTTFISSLFPSLHAWMTWFTTSQLMDTTTSRSILPFPGGPHGLSYAWRGRVLNGKKLNPNTLASGLDDYPRAMLPSDQERHVDLLCWLSRAATIMAKLQLRCAAANKLSPDVLSGVTRHLSFLAMAAGIDSITQGNEWNYESLARHLTDQLERIHWKDIAYFDIGAHDNDYEIVSEVLIRCRNATDNTFIDVGTDMEKFKQNLATCPKTHPTFMYPLKGVDTDVAIVERVTTKLKILSLQHVKHIGYPAIFPLLLQLLPATSNHLSPLLALISSPDHLWSKFGLRSLSTRDKFYRRSNSPGDASYWRSPIWMNINFLALKALRHYSRINGPDQIRAGNLYVSLRSNLLTTVLYEFEKSGDLWEHYDDVSGRGTRGHPFSGWTALIVNILYELL